MTTIIHTRSKIYECSNEPEILYNVYKFIQYENFIKFHSKSTTNLDNLYNLIVFETDEYYITINHDNEKHYGNDESLVIVVTKLIPNLPKIKIYNKNKAK